MTSSFFFVQPPPLPPFNAPMPEQAFLAKHYDENAKKPDRDPRGAFRNPTDTAAAGIVGPLGSSSFNLPTVERALSEMEAGMGMASSLNASTTADGARRPSQRAATGANVATHVGRPPSSPTIGTSPSPTGGQTQHEVLQNFFQSLLSSRDRGGTSATPKSTGPKTNGNTSGTDDPS
jgi:dynein light intermediate chain 1